MLWIRNWSGWSVRVQGGYLTRVHVEYIHKLYKNRSGWIAQRGYSDACTVTSKNSKSKKSHYFCVTSDTGAG